KVIQTIMNPDNQPDAVPMPGGGAPAGNMAPSTPSPGGFPGGSRPQQPNPRGGMAGNITPDTERNQRQQETAGELQATYLR
ncbi:hypothetical protein R0K05_19360, partial [Planococcus sp. SIMBA_160]